MGGNEPPKEIFGKTMRIPDELMREWFTLLTDRPTAEIDTILAGKPNEAKKALGADIVRFYHGDDAANAVLDDWKKQFENKGDPEHIDEVKIAAGGDLPVALRHRLGAVAHREQEVAHGLAACVAALRHAAIRTEVRKTCGLRPSRDSRRRR